MVQTGIALDLGTSGIRAQAVDLKTGHILSMAISMRNPIPGSNLVDHLQFALELGSGTAKNLLVYGINRILQHLGVDLHTLQRLAVNGNPVELSLFQGMAIFDLAYAGKNAYINTRALLPDRQGMLIKAGDFGGLDVPDDCMIIIPPSVKRCLGADGISMILQSGLIESKETALITDYGTNAEMALIHNGRIFTASAAAGSALEGQQLRFGMAAGPGVITDFSRGPGSFWTAQVLNEKMLPVSGPAIDLGTGEGAVSHRPEDLRGINGSGIAALLAVSLEGGLFVPPVLHTPDGKLHLGHGFDLTAEDCVETGKAIGAIRAGHMTLCQKAGIEYGKVQTIYMAGALGAYLDPVKARRTGLIPPGVRTVKLVGNTSLKMAAALLFDPGLLESMQDMAAELGADFCDLASSEVFKKIYLLELSHWSEGMPLSLYSTLLNRYGYGNLPNDPLDDMEVVREREGWESPEEINEVIVQDTGQFQKKHFKGCTSCSACVLHCPGAALKLESEGSDPFIVLDQSYCAGSVCRRCEKVCPVRVLHWESFFY